MGGVIKPSDPIPKISLEKILAERYGDAPDDPEVDRAAYHREYMRKWRARKEARANG